MSAPGRRWGLGYKLGDSNYEYISFHCSCGLTCSPHTYRHSLIRNDDEIPAATRTKGHSSLGRSVSTDSALSTASSCSLTSAWVGKDIQEDTALMWCISPPMCCQVARVYQLVVWSSYDSSDGFSVLCVSTEGQLGSCCLQVGASLFPRYVGELDYQIRNIFLQKEKSQIDNILVSFLVRFKGVF